MKSPTIDNYEEVIEKYPSSIEKYKAFLFEKLQVPELKEAVTNLVPAILQSDPRKLYDFFDKEDIIISIIHEDGAYKYSINENDWVEKDNRADCEVEAFIKSFEILENNAR